MKYMKYMIPLGKMVFAEYSNFTFEKLFYTVVLNTLVVYNVHGM